jgi:NTE family protein
VTLKGTTSEGRGFLGNDDRYRVLSRKKIGLALGSGSARGLAHIGVLKVLKAEGIPIDMIAGTSMGAVVGGLYALRRDITRIERLADEISWRRLLSLVDLTFHRTGLIRGQRVVAWAKSAIGDVQFRDLEIPFSCVATDIMTGREVVINEGSVMEAVRASSSIPGLFSLAKWRGQYLVDGGLVNPVPINTVKNMGAEFIIAVNVLPDTSLGDKTYWKTRRGKTGFKEPNMIEVLMQSMYIGARPLVQSALTGADIVIEPQVASIGPGDFRRARECILQGELAAVDCVQQLKRVL